MGRTNRKIWLLITMMSLALATIAMPTHGETITLKDGTVLQGTVIKRGDSYWVKTADGATRLISQDDVDHVGGAAAAVSVAPKATAPTSPAAGGKAAGKSPDAAATLPVAPSLATGSAAFMDVKGKADRVDAPILAVSLWEKFIETKPSASDLAAANAEMARWKQLDKAHAEKINGKWIGGDERKKLLKHVAELIRQSDDEMQSSETLKAVGHMEEALKLYPNSFEANFALGYYYLSKGAVGSNGQGNIAELDKGLKSLETAVKLRPNSAATLSNLAIAYNFRRRYEDSVVSAYKAAKIEDSPEIVQNLVNSIAHAPPGMQQNNTKVKPIMEEAAILARKHNIDLAGAGWVYVRPHEAGEVDATGKPVPGAGEGDDDSASPPGVVASGSGFFISPDGYFLTNKHVAGEKNRTFRIRFDDGSEKNADVVALDEDNDIALMHVKVDRPVPFLKLSPADEPNPAAKAMVLGYPASFQLGFKMQVTTGDVTSVDAQDPYPVTLTISTTHGNSGGPIIDKDENVIGILSAGEQIYNVTYVKAISAGQMRKFVAKLKDKFPNTMTPGPSTRPVFDGESLARDARRSTLLVLIIKGDSSPADAATK